MSTVRLAGTDKVLFKFPPLLLGEFIPVVEFDRTKFDSTYGFLGPGSAEVTLSTALDGSLRTFTPRVLDTEKRNITLPFLVKQGCQKSHDDDGIIDVKLSVSDPDIQIKLQSFKVNYTSTFELEIEIKKSSSVEFYIDFFAKDDTEDEYIQGEMKDIHCGRMMVRFKYTVTTDWEVIAPVIPKTKFVGWNHPGVKENCFDYALEQLRQVKHYVKSERWNKKWDGTKELNDHIYQLFLEQDVAGMKKGVQKDQFEKGVEYLKKTLKAGVPVMVGVDDDCRTSNDDMTTEHFVTIVGMGEDPTGKYFLFYDNATGDCDEGTSLNNKLYCNIATCTIEGKGDLRIDYIRNTAKKQYIVSQIRETK
jgi:hypothetical protein